MSNPEGDSLDANGCTIGGHLRLMWEGDHRFVSAGQLVLFNAKISGDLICLGACFSKRGEVAISAPSVTIGGNAIFNPDKQRCEVEGNFILAGGTIQGNLDLDGSCLSNAGGVALSAAGAQIGGGASFNVMGEHRFEADGDSTVLRLTRRKFENIAAQYPLVWKYIAQERSVRLAQRNRFVRPRNEQTQVFIICSKEALAVAQEVQASLTTDQVLCMVWTDGVFRAGQYAVEALEHTLEDKDFAIAIAAPDDFVTTRGQTHIVPRDNVIFELGMFMGVLGRQRTFLMESRDEAIKLPSDLKGLITVPYKTAKQPKLRATLAPACQELRTQIEALGPL